MIRLILLILKITYESLIKKIKRFFQINQKSFKISFAIYFARIVSNKINASPKHIITNYSYINKSQSINNPLKYDMGINFKDPKKCFETSTFIKF